MPEERSPAEQPPRSLSSVLDRVETVDLSEDGYPGVQVTLWVSPPDRLVQDWMTTQAPATVILGQVIRGWNLQTDAGQPIAITADTVAQLPGDVAGMLLDEFSRRRLAPLVARRTRDLSITTAGTPPPSMPPMPSFPTPNGSASPSGS